MPSRLYVSAAMLVLALTATASAQQGVAWRSDLAAAQQEARSSGRLVLMHFWTESCGPCKRLDAMVFNQPNVGAAIESRYVPVKLNANESAEIALKMGVTRVPTDIVATADGQVVERLISPATPMDYIGKMTQLAAAHSSRPGGAFDQAAAAAPQASQLAPAVANSAYANLSLSNSDMQTTAGAIARATGSPAAAAYTNQPTANPGGGSRYAGVAAETSSPYASRPAAPAAASAAPVAPPVAAAPPASNPYFQAATQAQAPAVQPPAVQQVAAQKTTPSVEPQFGFDGYCPVTMKQQWRWVKGDPQWGAVHRGSTYLFTGQEQRDEFLRDPDAYSPVLSGVDPVVALEQQRSVPGKRAFALEYGGNFYLFSSEETLSRFWADADRYANGVRAAMNPAGGGRLVR
ncbi:Thioredoxin [Pseudobythopirellula maris]|uniref:Thioredoxin n=1 Tax=Pseudobythopirellula maris TaxID=2527991 RepID=A0A5C5ZSF6_9BACT|nr:thioredoxin family protein [Pseudobythopirellula maris]TWT90474.1 Thioredoxin [Pseudobythopirellula maris]